LRDILLPTPVLPPPPVAEPPVFRTTVAGPRPCAWYEDEQNDRTCTFPGVNFLLAIAGGIVLFAVVGRRK
jgi:hypothetical protein